MNLQHPNKFGTKIRFPFGENWLNFLSLISDKRISLAEQSLVNMLKFQNLHGKRFLDVGCGSGLVSLAALRLGAKVHSFDYDSRSVACANELKSRYGFGDVDWQIETGSVLDKQYLESLGRFDIVYSWGVLHHTGNMYQAFSNIIDNVSPGGRLFIAIYNDQGILSKYWTWVKRYYNQVLFVRLILILIYLPYFVGMRWLVRAVTKKRNIERGMSLWYDMLDWLGGYPFEVAKPEAVFNFFRKNGFVLEGLKTNGGRSSCNEFIFLRTDGN